MITITLQKISDNNPCQDGWKKVVKAHEHPVMDTEFPLTSVLESNDLYDTIWCFRCLPEHENLWRKYAVWCCRQVEHLMTDERSINALNVAWRHSDGLASDAARVAAWVAAEDAAWDVRIAAEDAAEYAAWAAAWATARDVGAAARAARAAVWDVGAAARAARDAAGAAAGAAARATARAARDAAWATAARDAAGAAEAAQQKKLIQILTAGQWVNDDGSLYVACQQGGEEKKQ